MTDILGKPRRRVHRCGNCIMWKANESGLTGICEIGDMQPLAGFDGNGVDTDEGFRTTPETYCDHQVPAPPPGPPCPKCGAPMVQGYGLAGGGIGAYEFCEAEGCDHFEKWPDPELSTPEEMAAFEAARTVGGSASPQTSGQANDRNPK